MAVIQLTRKQVEDIFRANNVKTHLEPHNVAILAVRDADGDGNEFNVYDDRMFVVSQNDFKAFEANTDPAKHTTGIAQLKSNQIIRYRPGRHKFKSGYAAFRQASNAHIDRKGSRPEFANIGANIHRGGNINTSSIACQTLRPTVWEPFRRHIYGILGVQEATAQTSPGGFGPTFEYLLLDRRTVDGMVQGAAAPAPHAEPNRSESLRYSFGGVEIPNVRVVADVGYAPTRATLGLFTGIKPEFLNFAQPTGEDIDFQPDLLWLSPSGGKFPLDLLDTESDVTFARLTHLALAAGLTWTVDSAARQVVFA